MQDLDKDTERYDALENSIKDIMKYYGLIPDQMGIFVFELTYDAIAYAVHGSSIVGISRFLEISSLLTFLKNCEGGELRLQGTITSSQSDRPKGSTDEVRVTNKDFIRDLISFVESWTIDNFHFYTSISDDKPITEVPTHMLITQHSSLFGQLIKSMKGNAQLGECAFHLISTSIKHINCSHGNGWTKTKLYSFVYDIMRLCKRIGRKCIVEDGYSGYVGREKFKAVDNWIRALEKTGLIRDA